MMLPSIGSSPSTSATPAGGETTAPLLMSNGSARLLLGCGGETHVLCSIKADVVQPSLEHPSRGVMELHIEDATTASTSRMDGLESTLSHLLLPHLIPTSITKQQQDVLCIVPRYYVWRLSIDLTLISAEGGSIVDACGRVVQAALATTKLPALSTVEKATITSFMEDDDADVDTLFTGGSNKKDGNQHHKPVLQVDSDIAHAKPIIQEEAPLVITVTVLKCMVPGKPKPTTLLLLDATLEEEACAYCQVHVTLRHPKTNDDGNNNKKQQQPTICAIQKAGGGSLPFELLQDITTFCLEAWQSRDTSITQVPMEPKHYLLQEQFSIQQ